MHNPKSNTTKNHNTQHWFEHLEPRTLLSATIDPTGLLTINGTPGNDQLTIAPGKDPGQIIIRGNITDANGQYNNVNAVTILTGDGHDRIKIKGKHKNPYGTPLGFNINAGPGDDRIKASKANDTIHAGPGNDRIKAAQGDDTILPGPGADRLNGGPGSDTVSYEDATEPINVSLAQRKALHDGFGHSDPKINAIENVTGSSFNDTIQGNNRDNTLDGGPGIDQIDGLKGNDTLLRPFPAKAPTITVALANDTGPDPADRITSDTTITGAVTDEDDITKFHVALNPTNADDFTNALPDLNPDNTFTLTPERLDEINHAPLPLGDHTLHLQATDQYNNTRITTFKFTKTESIPVEIDRITIKRTNLGSHIAVSGNTAIAGAPSDGSGIALPSAPGTAYLIDITTGETTRLTYDFPFGTDDFGTTVAISPNHAAVGQKLDNDPEPFAGSVHLFDPTTGEYRRKLNASDAKHGDRFGTIIAINDNILIVGASHDDHGAFSDAGSAYIFNADTGAQLRKITAPTHADNTYFGAGVAIDGNTIVVGAPGIGSFRYNGRAYVFDATTGKLLHELIAPETIHRGSYGGAVAVQGNIAIVSAPLHQDTGAAFVFDVTTGEFLFKLTGSDSTPVANIPPTSGDNDRFGNAITISGDYALVAAINEGIDRHHEFGAAYLFDITTGEQLAKLTAPDKTRYGRFGSSVAIAGDTALVSSSSKDTLYFFNIG